MTEFFDDAQQFLSDHSTWLRIALAVVVALAIIGVLAAMWMSKKRAWDRKHAAALRREAEDRAARLDTQEAESRRLEAEAQRARAEADRLEAVAARKRSDLAAERKEYVARLDEADKLDGGRGRQEQDSSAYHGTHAAR